MRWSNNISLISHFYYTMLNIFHYADFILNLHFAAPFPKLFFFVKPLFIPFIFISPIFFCVDNISLEIFVSIVIYDFSILPRSFHVTCSHFMFSNIYFLSTVLFRLFTDYCTSFFLSARFIFHTPGYIKIKYHYSVFRIRRIYLLYSIFYSFQFKILYIVYIFWEFFEYKHIHCFKQFEELWSSSIFYV